jgi:diacylglycerol kinase (ATP)
MKKQNFLSLRRVLPAFRYSLSGLRHAAGGESAFQQELIVLGVMTIVCLVLPVDLYLKVQLLILHLLILIVELLNSAVESVADKLCSEMDPLIKQAKDMGSAAVLLAFMASALLWGYAIYTLLKA